MSKHKNYSLYFAYGANLSLDSMNRRCPTAVPLRTATIHGFKLVFRGVCDIETCEGSSVHGGIYRVNPLDILALDRYEGVAIGAYHQIILDETDGLFAYTMGRDDPIMPPLPCYLSSVQQGYRDWNLPEDQLDAALSASLDPHTALAHTQ